MLNAPPVDITKFTYKLKSYLKWINEFGSVLGCEVKHNALTFLPANGEGTASAYGFEKGLTACVNNYQLANDYLLTREPSDQYGVLIYFYRFQSSIPVQYDLETISIDMAIDNSYSLSFMNAQTWQQVLLAKSTFVRGMSIFVDNGWMARNLNQPVIEVFNYLQKVNYFKQFITAKLQRLMNEILDVPDNHPWRDFYIRSRILRIFDKLLENCSQHDISELPEKINEDDFNTLQRIEAILSGSYNEAFPGIERLSRLSLMSESKLKKLFKQSFGMGLYEYYQKNRMHKAKERIISGKYSISEVGTNLGYQNLSNFSAAFRKEFNCLPSELNIND